jgi:hypothetical protein
MDVGRWLGCPTFSLDLRGFQRVDIQMHRAILFLDDVESDYACCSALLKCTPLGEFLLKP